MTRASLSRLVATSVVLMALASPVAAGEVTLAWNPNAEPNIAGYVVWYGTQSGVYTSSIDVGGRTTWTVTGLVDGQQYFFAVQAYTTARIMSPMSAEVSTVLPASGGDTSACTTPRPGPDWTCNAATGGWLPPGYGNAGGGSAGPCTTPRPGADWTCNAATGGWLPPGYTEEQSSSSGGEKARLLYLYDPASGSLLTGWAELSAAEAAGGRTDVLRNKEKLGEWYPGPTSNDRGFTFNAGSAQGVVPIGAELTVWQPSTGMWYVLKTDNGRDFTSQTAVPLGDGAAGDRPVPGDYDGDKKTDVAVYRTSDRMWYVLTSSTGYAASRTVVWGEAGDVPVPADYDGDGRTDVAVWRPSTGEWLVLKSSNEYDVAQGVLRVQWGEQGDVPVPGDYDGDGAVDMAVWRPSSGDWWVLPASSNYDWLRGYLRTHGKAPADISLRR